MTDLDPAPSSIRDDSICESSLNKSSGDIGELKPCPFCRRGYVGCYNNIDRIESESNTKRWVLECSSCAVTFHAENNESQEEVLAWWNTRTPDPESAAKIERLKREVASLQRALLFWMPGVDLRLDEATRERAAQDAGLLAGLLAGYPEPLDGPCWGDGMLDRALSAESAVAAADLAFSTLQKCVQDVLDGDFGPRFASKHDQCPHKKFQWEDCGNCIDEHLSKGLTAASAIRAAVSKKTAESGHSPSTRERE